MGLFDFLSPNKKAAKAGCEWAIGDYERARKANPSRSSEKILNNLFEARFQRASLSKDQKERFEKYKGKLRSLFDLVMATGDVESNIFQDPNAFDDAARAVYDELSRARYISVAYQVCVDRFLEIS